MHDDDTMNESTWTPPSMEDVDAPYVPQLSSLMDVLSPATPPPVPRNARVISKLGLIPSRGPARHDPMSPVTGSANVATSIHSRSELRRAARALRMTSLGIAAGLKND